MRLKNSPKLTKSAHQDVALFCPENGGSLICGIAVDIGSPSVDGVDGVDEEEVGEVSEEDAE